MEFRAGSPVDAEAIAGLIASFQSELTDDPSGVGAEEYLASCPYRPSVGTWPQNATGTLSLTRILNLPASLPSEMAPTFFHLFVERSHQPQDIARRLWERALRELCAPSSNGAFTVKLEFFRRAGSKPSALFQQGHYRMCMASRFCPCGVRHC